MPVSKSSRSLSKAAQGAVVKPVAREKSEQGSPYSISGSLAAANRGRVARASTIGRGVGSHYWSPLELPSILSRYVSSDLALLADGATVSLWRDQLGLYDLNEKRTTGGAFPVWEKSTQSVKFITSGIGIGNSSMALVAPYTLYAIFAHLSVSKTNTRVLTTGAENSLMTLDRPDGTNNSHYLQGQLGLYRSLDVLFHLDVMSAGTSSNSYDFVDGIERTLNPAATSPWTQFWIGCSNAYNESANARVKEVGVIQRQLTGHELDLLYEYARITYLE